LKQAFKEVKFNKKSLERLALVEQIIEEYQTQRLKLTLRQLYYQMVSRDYIPNEKREYDKLSVLLSKARWGGYVDWDIIEDRLRTPKLSYHVENVKSALLELSRYYRIDRQNGQPNYIEVWVEKDSLSSVLAPVTNKYHIRLMVNRGYSSTTAMHDAFGRFWEAGSYGQELYILYIGDHDASGLDMLRDIKERLADFGVVVTVVPIALTYAQVEQYNPPPNFAKRKDPRADWYIEKFGKNSWEVDALRPEVLNQLLVDAIEMRVDMELYNKALEKEWKDIKRLKQLARTESRKGKDGKK